MKRTVLYLLVFAMLLSVGFNATAEDERVKISIFCDADTTFVPETNPIVKAIEEACNVKLDYILPSQNNYTEQLNLTMASGGDYPDIVQFPGVGSPSFIDSAKNGILIALDEYIDNYKNLVDYVDPSSYTAMRSAVTDGKLYGVPRNSVMRTDGWLVRNDWLENVGIEIDDCSALTKDEFHNILHAFTYDDPDGNGEDDTYGLANGTVTCLFPGAFDCLGWQKADEGSEYEYMNAVYDRNSNKYVDALAYTAMLWKDGVIDPNDITNSGNAYRERFYDGTVGVVRMFGGWLNTYEDALHENFPGVETKYIVGIKNDNDECVGTSTLGGNIYGFVSITKSAEDKLEKVLEVLDYMMSDEGWALLCDGTEGWTYTVDENGKKVATEEFSAFSKYRNSMSLNRRYNEPGYFVLLNNTVYDRSWAYIQAACDITVGTCEMGFTPSAAQSDKYKDYSTTMNVALNNILIGEAEPETYFEALDGWYENGGEEYVAEMNEYISALN